VGSCVLVLEREKALPLLALLLGDLEIISAEMGIRASVDADSWALEAAAVRFLEAHRLSEEHGLPHPLGATL
jgi:hypothetical protein